MRFTPLSPPMQEEEEEEEEGQADQLWALWPPDEPIPRLRGQKCRVTTGSWPCGQPCSFGKNHNCRAAAHTTASRSIVLWLSKPKGRKRGTDVITEWCDHPQ